MSFPTELLEGYPFTVLSLTDDQAKLLVFVGKDGIHGLARDLASQCPAAVFPVTPTRYTIEHSEFRGDITRCPAFPGTVVLEVRAPAVDVRNVLGVLPVAVAKYVVSQTGSAWCGMIARLGTLAMLNHFAPMLARSGSRNPRRRSSS